MDRAPQSRRRLAALLATVLLVAGVSLVGLSHPAQACMWTPPPAFCAKTLVLSYAVERVLLLPGGGTFDVEALVYFDLFDFPPGSGICPAGPYTVDIAFTLTCTGGGGGVGSVAGVSLVSGFNRFTVPVSLGAGPPRLCSLAGTATTTLADGMEVVAKPAAMPTCVGEPAPDDPSVPRVDLFLGSDDPIVSVHPGDQASHRYTLVNNDPNVPYEGVLTVEMVSTSKMPMASGPMPPGTGPFSVSDPGPGDNFPIGFTHHLFEGCLPLPPDPAGFTSSLIRQPVLLPPGQSLEVELFSRPWGMCKHGSCGQASVVLDGSFADASDGLACAGLVTAADVGVPPTYLWADGGQVAQIQVPANPQLGILPFQAAPLPGPPLLLEMHTQNPQLVIEGQPIPGRFQLFSHPFAGPDHGRTQMQLDGGGNPLFLPPQPFDFFGHVEILPPPGAPFDTQIQDLQLIGGPTGFEQVAPGLEGIIGILPPGPPVIDSFFDITWQISGIGVDENGERRDLVFDLVELMPTSSTGFDVHVAGQVAPGSGSEIRALELYIDLHALAFEQPSPLLFLDGFDSGDTSAWTLTVP